MCPDLNEYNNTVNFLYGLQKHGIKLGLANITALMKVLEIPRRPFRAVHIAGTNGKGSTSGAIASILRENGFRVGLYTSPHLVSFTERIRINGQKISEAGVIELASRVRRSISGSDLNPTFFEFVTAMAFYYFAAEHIDWAVVETGMGGRLDATNILEPDISIITNIGLDHSEFLGSTISDIAYEKAGIIKPGTPVITASLLPDIVRQLSDIAKQRGSDIHVFDRDFRGSVVEMDDRHIVMDYSGYNELMGLSVNLTGKYQLYNTCTAVRAIEVLQRKGVDVTDTAIRAGLQNIDIEGRLEWVSKAPPIILDSAHNPDAADSLASSMKELFPDKDIILVAGIMDDKDAGGILHPLVKIAGPVILTRPDYSRAATTEKLEKIVREFREPDTGRNVFTSGSVAGAIELAKGLWKDGSIILIAGSFYTAGEAKTALGCSAVMQRLRE